MHTVYTRNATRTYTHMYIIIHSQVSTHNMNTCVHIIIPVYSFWGTRVRVCGVFVFHTV